MDEQRSPAVIDRRDLLRRGAVLGGAGALAWVAPSVTTFGARAFAAGTGVVVGGEGAISWVIVWYVSSNGYYRVKYQGSSGYQAEPGPSDVSSFGPEATAYWDTQEDQAKSALVGSFPAAPRSFFSSVSVPGVTPGVDVNGRLTIEIAADSPTRVAGWLLHDGSCQADGEETGKGGFQMKVRSPEYPYSEGLTPYPELVDGILVGPPRSELTSAAAAPNGEEAFSFLWQTCS